MTRTHTQQEAFSNLLRVLETIPDKQFSLKDWMSVNECGSVGCAIGWCAVDPWFNAHGLTLLRGKTARPTYIDEQYNSWFGVQLFFDIDAKTAVHFFSEEVYPTQYTKQDVINRIKQWIEDNHPEWETA